MLAIMTIANRETISVDIQVTDLDQAPLISSRNTAGHGLCTAATLCYNGAFAPSTAASPAGLLLRLRNMSSVPCAPHPKTGPCPGSHIGPSMLGWSIRSMAGGSPKFADVPPSAIVFRPNGSLAELNGTEDPRITLDPSTGVFLLAYTAFGRNPGGGVHLVLSLASTKTPGVTSSWVRHGPAVQGYPNRTKSGAMLLRPHPLPSFLIFLDTESKSATLAVSTDASRTSWRVARLYGASFISPRPGLFDSALTEPGPGPLPLSDGVHWIWFYNGSEENRNGTRFRPGCYQSIKTMYSVGWVLLRVAPSGLDLEIVERAATPLLTPAEVGDWALGGGTGVLCKQPNIVFVEGAESLTREGGADRFRIYFGAADATEGSAEVTVRLTARVRATAI